MRKVIRMEVDNERNVKKKLKWTKKEKKYKKTVEVILKGN